MRIPDRRSELTENTYSTENQLPCTLNAGDIAAYLGISRANAYVLLHSEGFPTLHIGKRMVTPRDKFLQWIDMNTQMPGITS